MKKASFKRVLSSLLMIGLIGVSFAAAEEPAVMPDSVVSAPVPMDEPDGSFNPGDVIAPEVPKTEQGSVSTPSSEDDKPSTPVTPEETPAEKDKPDTSEKTESKQTTDTKTDDKADTKQTADTKTDDKTDTKQTADTKTDKKTDTKQTTDTKTDKKTETKQTVDTKPAEKTEAPKNGNTQTASAPAAIIDDSALEELPDGRPEIHTGDEYESTGNANAADMTETVPENSTAADIPLPADPQPAEEYNHETVGAPAENGGNSSRFPLRTLLIAIAVLLFAAAVILLIRRLAAGRGAAAAGTTLTLELLETDGSVAERVETYFKRRATIGSNENCDISIDDDTVSPRHCRLVRRENGIYVEDMNSEKGTRLNGEMIEEPTELQPGTIITLGDVSVRFLR